MKYYSQLINCLKNYGSLDYYDKSIEVLDYFISEFKEEHKADIQIFLEQEIKAVAKNSFSYDFTNNSEILDRVSVIVFILEIKKNLISHDLWNILTSFVTNQSKTLQQAVYNLIMIISEDELLDLKSQFEKLFEKLDEKFHDNTLVLNVDSFRSIAR